MGNQNADVGYQNMIASPMMQLFDDNTEFILESNINKVQDRRFNQPNQQRQQNQQRHKTKKTNKISPKKHKNKKQKINTNFNKTNTQII
jgi:hypothetical protein